MTRLMIGGSALRMPSPRPVHLARWCVTGVSIVLALALAACATSTNSSSTAAVAARSAVTTSSSSPTSSASATVATQPTGTGTGTGTGTTAASALPGYGKQVVTIGDKNYTEQFVLGQLYLQALQADGFTVNLNDNIGPTEVTTQALSAGTLAMYPEYLDLFNTAVAGYKHSFRTQFDAYAAAQRYALAHGLDLLSPTPFSDTDAIGVTVAYAADNRLRTIRDLHRVASSLTVGGPPQFQQDAPGLTEIEQAYGVTPAAFKVLAIGDQYAALNDGVVQAADVNTTDGQLSSGDYTLLRDPHRIFGWGNVVPVISAKALAAEGPAFATTIDRVDAALTTSAMRQLNSDVDVAQQNPADVAKQFLETHGLLTPAPS
jgi:osmoprotectant transport system substrate-binding protein